MADKRRRARRLVLQALYQWQIASSSVSQVEAEFLVDNDMEKVDKEFFRELLRGVTSQVKALDEALTPCIDRKVEDLDPIELSVIRMGAYELINRIDVPYRVAINEAVELTKKFGGTDGHKFVNSVLDKLAPKFREVEINASRSKR
ncbi:transcription antitermination factor NusB [Hahella sp. CCB-MM4]|uniref:transcription antitermination factor NusB n=1 Tax=Hahella sp. (strain CCB-MM4) TaxID=1926491 RepID=UPI000B9C4E5B|nr:transcription antitermination factor NusB [Hahella sp. CCB-MM4]